MRFRPEDTSDSRAKPPPNYYSRRVQYRLLALVFTFMLVLVLMQKARDPSIWRIFFPDENAAQPERVLNTRPPVQPDYERNDPPGVITMGQPGGAAPDLDVPDLNVPIAVPDLGIPADNPEDANAEDVERADALVRARHDAWQRFLVQLGKDRKQFLLDVLRRVRANDELSDEQQTQWSRLVNELDELWETWLSSANDGVVFSSHELSDSQKGAWLNVLHQLKMEWETELEPALTAIAGESETLGMNTRLSVTQREKLEDLQSVFDFLALQRIRDRTILSRPGEVDAWFRCFEILRQNDSGELARQSTGRVGFLQMFDQPETYRGKLVTTRGTVRMAYHVRAPKNALGIEGYYVYWLKPAGGLNTPIAVYALETPPGFPKIKDKDVDGGTTRLNEDVEVTGFFYKIWAYRSVGGIDTTPLMLARVPTWESRADTTPGTGLPSAVYVVGAIGCAVVIGIGISVFAWLQSKGDAETSARPLPDQMAALPEDEVSPPVGERLRRMSDDQNDYD